MSYNNQVLLRIISLCCPPSHILLKRPFFPFQFGQEENISGNSTERRIYRFILKIVRVFTVPTGRVGIV